MPIELTPAVLPARRTCPAIRWLASRIIPAVGIALFLLCVAQWISAVHGRPEIRIQPAAVDRWCLDAWARSGYPTAAPQNGTTP